MNKSVVLGRRIAVDGQSPGMDEHQRSRHVEREVGCDVNEHVSVNVNEKVRDGAERG
jgi:hypothetical protein